MKTKEEILAKRFNTTSELLDTNAHCKVSSTLLAMEEYADQYRSKWISVKERLPDMQGSYLVFTILDIVCISNYIFHDGKWDWSGRHDKNYITDWMEIPKKPR